jgi:hypothetical protein
VGRWLAGEKLNEVGIVGWLNIVSLSPVRVGIRLILCTHSIEYQVNKNKKSMQNIFM